MISNKGQIGISVTGLVLFFVSFVVLIALLPTIMDFIATAQGIETLDTGTKVVIGLIPLMLGVAALISAISSKEIG